MINIGFVSLDILIILVAIVILILLSYKMGKKTITTLILSVYPSILIFQYFPYVSFDAGRPEAVSFVIIYMITFIILSKNITNKKLHTPIRKITDYTLLSLSFIALMISVSSNLITSLQNLYTFSGVIPNLINGINFGVVMIVPLLILLITNKSDNY